MTPKSSPQKVIIGQIVGVYGVKGWVKIHSYTKPIENILKYRCWQVSVGGTWQNKTLLTGRKQGKGLVGHIEGVEDRDLARALINAEVAIERSELPKIAEDEYYWTDLIGLEVATLDGQVLGIVDHLFETGANDVLVVKGAREHCIPYIRDDVVRSIDLEAGRLDVDWDPDF